MPTTVPGPSSTADTPVLGRELVKPATSVQRRLIGGGIAALLLLTALILLVPWPGQSGSGGPLGRGPATGESGQGALGNAPQATATAGTGPGGPNATANPGATPASSTVVSSPARSGPPNGPIKVSAEARPGGLLSYTVAVTVLNADSVAHTWHSVLLRLDGLNLMVASNDGDVSYAPTAGEHCFVPAPGTGGLAAKGTKSFTVTVSAVTLLDLGTFNSVSVEQAPCPT